MDAHRLSFLCYDKWYWDFRWVLDPSFGAMEQFAKAHSYLQEQPRGKHICLAHDRMGTSPTRMMQAIFRRVTKKTNALTASKGFEAPNTVEAHRLNPLQQLALMWIIGGRVVAS